MKTRMDAEERTSKGVDKDGSRYCALVHHSLALSSSPDHHAPLVLVLAVPEFLVVGWK